MRRLLLIALSVCLGCHLLAGLASNAFAQTPQPAKEKAKTPKREPDVVFVPTPQAVVDKMLELAKVGKDDLVYDLGCGDGRIVVTAAQKFGCKAIGFDIATERVKESMENVAKAGVGDKVRIEQRDIFTLDLSPASVVTLYLLPSLNVKLIPQLEKLKPGCRIVSHDFDMKGVKPDKVITLDEALAKKNWNASVHVGWDPLHVQVTGMTADDAKVGKRPPLPVADSTTGTGTPCDGCRIGAFRTDGITHAGNNSNHFGAEGREVPGNITEAGAWIHN